MSTCCFSSMYVMNVCMYECVQHTYFLKGGQHGGGVLSFFQATGNTMGVYKGICHLGTRFSYHNTRSVG